MHPLRAWLRTTWVAGLVRQHPLLYRLAVRAWYAGRSILSVSVVVFDPVMLLYTPYLAGVFLLALLPRSRTARIASPSREIVMLVISDVPRDPRVEREARALAGAGFLVKILYPAYTQDLQPSLPDWGSDIKLIPLPAHYAQFVRRFPYVLGFSLLRRALRERPFAFHAHDLCTSLIGLAAARSRRTRCVCDFHEWYSENVTWDEATDSYSSHAPSVKRLYSRLERLSLSNADAVVTVCDSIARELERMSGGTTQVHVIRNIPDLRQTPGEPSSLRSVLGLPPDVFLLLYQGGVGPTRMLEALIEAMALVPRGIFVIRGPGVERYGASYERLACSLGIAQRIIVLPPVPSKDVVAGAVGADAGIWTLPRLCKNFEYALPNKVFEYMAAGIPILAANYPEVSRLVNEYRVGLTFDPYSSSSIAEAVNTLIDEPRLRAEFGANTRVALHALRADAEFEKLVRIYTDMRTEDRRMAMPPAA